MTRWVWTLLALTALGCTPPTPVDGEPPTNLPDGGVTCRADGYLYVDTLCGYGASTCSDAGDGLCHRLCTTDADCGALSTCKNVCLFHGSDGCTQGPAICQPATR